MLVEVVVLFSVCACAYVCYSWVKTKRYWADRGVPYEPPHPIFGSLTFLQKENPAFWLRRLREQFKGPYVGIWLFWKPALVVQCPEIARRVLVKDADNFRNRYLSSGKRDPVGALNIFTVDDPLWSSIRRRLTSVFTGAKLRSMEGLVKSKTDDLIERIRAEMEKTPNEIEVKVICTDYTTDIIGESSFGIQSAATRAGDSVIRRVTRDFTHFSLLRGIAWSSIFFFPKIVDIFGFKMFPLSATECLRSVFRQATALRGGLARPVTEPRDLLDLLIKISQEASADHEEMSEDILVAQATIFVQGGFDTSGAALSFTLLELAHQPHLQEKLHQELIEAQERYGKELDSAALAEIPYLNAVIKETLRKYPPMGWMDRVATADYAIDDKLTIPAGTVVYVNAVGLARDPDYFPDPDRYDPDRFMPDNEKNVQPYTYMPFGAGPRNCIGMRFAQQTLRHAVAQLCLRYRVRPAAACPPPEHFPITPRSMLLLPGGPILLRFTRRE